MSDGRATEASGLTRRYGETAAVDGLGLRVPSRAVYGCLGPNGAGKSTTVRRLATLTKPSGGATVAGFLVSVTLVGADRRFFVGVVRSSMATDESGANGEAAARVVISHPAELGEWSRDQLDADRYRTYLRRTVGDLAVGKEFEEFVDVGCCGNSPDITLRIESYEGPARMGPETEIEFVERDGSVENGWEVQSAAGPE